MDDLVDVEEQYLSALLPSVPRTQLIRAFKAYGCKESMYWVSSSISMRLQIDIIIYI